MEISNTDVCATDVSVTNGSATDATDVTNTVTSIYFTGIAGTYVGVMDAAADDAENGVAIEIGVI